MDATLLRCPEVIHYDTLHSFPEVEGLHLSLIKAEGENDGFLHGPPCLHLILNAIDGAYERVFSVNEGHQNLALAIGQGMTLALSMARAEWDSPAATPSPQPMGTVIPFPKPCRETSHAPD